MKEKAHKRAELFEPQKQKNVHHIVSKFTANKYNLPTPLVKNDNNAIALEKDFHDWIHGQRLTKAQFINLMKDDCFQKLFELEKQIDEFEVEYKGFDNDDYICLAVAYLGIAQEYFNEQRVYQRKPKAKRRKRRH